MDEKIQILPGGAVLVDYGPMHLVIRASDRGKPLVDLAEAGGRVALGVLDDLARFLPVIKRKASELEIKGEYPDVVRRMIDATKKMEEPDLTPLAAVAGAASDVVADYVIGQGGTKVTVDNGGDIAIRLREGDAARVGVKIDINAEKPVYVLTIDSSLRLGGVTTSGLGGRSFTKGIAAAATVVGATASIADAAATVIANFTNVEDPAIERALAEEIYPDTDIIGEWVTTRVGNLSGRKVRKALKNGLEKANAVCERGLIAGALIALRGEVVWTRSMESLLTKMV
jgi:uncharacterized protein